MTNQLTHIWLVTHDFGDGELQHTAWTAEAKAREHVEKLKAQIAETEGWEPTEDGPETTWIREDYDDTVSLLSLNVDEAQ